MIHAIAGYYQIRNASIIDAFTGHFTAQTHGGYESRSTQLCDPALFNADRFQRFVTAQQPVDCPKCLLIAQVIEANDIDISQHDGCVKLATILDGK